MGCKKKTTKIFFSSVSLPSRESACFPSTAEAESKQNKTETQKATPPKSLKIRCQSSASRVVLVVRSRDRGEARVWELGRKAPRWGVSEEGTGKGEAGLGCQPRAARGAQGPGGRVPSEPGFRFPTVRGSAGHP